MDDKEEKEEEEAEAYNKNVPHLIAYIVYICM